MTKLNDSNFHLPYNPKLIPIAKELRQNPTPAEKKLWEDFLRNFPFRVLRQRPIDNFIVDFYCAALRLVIEVDGESHFTEQGNNMMRKEQGFLRGMDCKLSGLRMLMCCSVLREFVRSCWVRAIVILRARS